MGRRNIVIAGAGIGGLSAALALVKQGFHVVICERAEKLSEVGAGIQLTPNAIRALHALGLREALAAVASEPAAIDIRSGRRASLLTSIETAAIEKRYGLPWLVLARVELQAVLAAAVEANPSIELNLGAPVTEFVAGPEEILVRTGGHTPTVMPAAAFIAADGVSSAMREKISGVAARPIGRTAWRATVPTRAAPASLPTDRIGLWLGPNAHLVHYPISGGRTVNIVAILEESWQGVGWSEPGDPRQLAAHFTSWSPAARAIIAAPGEWRKWAILSVDPAGSWVSDRTALLGDAAHAMPPFLAQGAAMAIEDAAVLAAALGASPEDIPAALKTYEKRRKDRAARVHAAVFRTGARYHMRGPLAALRDTMLRVAGSRIIPGMNDWIYGWKPPA